MPALFKRLWVALLLACASLTAASPLVAANRVGERKLASLATSRRLLEAAADQEPQEQKQAATPDAETAAAAATALPADARSQVTNSTLPKLLESMASPRERAIIFTTFTLGANAAGTQTAQAALAPQVDTPGGHARQHMYRAGPAAYRTCCCRLPPPSRLDAIMCLAAQFAAPQLLVLPLTAVLTLFPMA